MALPDFDLTGEVVALTGGAGILGSRFTAALASRGATVALIDREASRAEEVARNAAAQCANRVRPYTADVSDRASIQAAAQRISHELGPVTVLVNAAASKSEHFFEPFETFPLEDWDYVMRINCTGAMLACQAFGPGMAGRRRGSIVNILSVYGIVAPDPRIYQGSLYEGRAINTPAIYSASKAALWGLTRYLASYWAPSGVRVNALTPGGVYSGQNETFVSRYSARVPLGRMAGEDEFSGALVYLCASASSYMTGQNIVVDGGLTAW
jgi:NAD(P)-dependent dehydrogenase (short-subunit alcohol dehydrogenase family)